MLTRLAIMIGALIVMGAAVVGAPLAPVAVAALIAAAYLWQQRDLLAAGAGRPEGLSMRDHMAAGFIYLACFYCLAVALGGVYALMRAGWLFFRG